MGAATLLGTKVTQAPKEALLEIRTALKTARWSVTTAAEVLKVNRVTLWRWIGALGLAKEVEREVEKVNKANAPTVKKKATRRKVA